MIIFKRSNIQIKKKSPKFAKWRQDINTSNNSSHSRNKTMTIEYTIHGFILDGNLRKETASLFEMFNAFD